MDISKYIILPLMGTSLSLPTSAQVSSENYVQTTLRISDTQVLASLYYGKKGRVVQSHSSNLLGGFEHTDSSYTYAGSPLHTRHVHTANGNI